MKLRIGVDFDNTLIRYDEVFRDLAAERGWAAGGASKAAIKRRLLAEDGNDLRWQALQALAYGPEIGKARAYPGFVEFLRAAFRRGDDVFIVSHKSAASHYDPAVRLREAALEWLKDNRLVVNGHPDPSRIPASRVIFAGTRDEKVAAISKLRLDLFVDDLPEVLEHPRFPKSTLGVHFEGGRGWTRAAELAERLAAIGPEAHAAILRTLKSAPVRVSPAGRGGNNRVLAVTLADGRKVLLKRYLLDSRDGRDRAGAEFAALELMWTSGLRAAAKPLYKDPSGAFALHSLLPGRSMAGRAASRVHVTKAVAFLRKVQALRGKAAKIAAAADSRTCLADYPRHLERRLARIEAGLPQAPAAARAFVRKDVRPAMDALIAAFKRRCGADLDAKLPRSKQILSPSDFGFHNAVEAPNGELRFVDFEYFGWDDPAKLAADFSHHAGQRVSPALKALFRDGLAKLVPDRAGFERRLALVDGLVAFEWVLIVLNVLSPESLTRRRFSDPKRKVSALVGERLRRAKEMLRRIT
ncbi:MAG: hypothetical protein HYX59_11770 [Elusimicrobia bacterium]|nr:hypothetical protein [Elusimicrobiota bacterium]